MSHHIDKCVHGIVVTQCRCMKPDKEVRIVPCPPRCQRKNEVPDRVTVTIPAEDVGILLEYAYQDQGLVGGRCHVNRVDDCAVCETFNRVEDALRRVVPEDEMPRREWWRDADPVPDVPDDPDDMLYDAWAVIANAMDWALENSRSQEWVEVAERWRDRYHRHLDQVRIAELAAEAERGYDPDRLVSRRHSPDNPATIVSEQVTGSKEDYDES